MTDDEMEEVLALINKEGVPTFAALAIARGEYTLEWYRMKKEIAEQAALWAADSSNLLLPQTPRWDLEPANFHLSMDGFQGPGRCGWASFSTQKT